MLSDVVGVSGNKKMLIMGRGARVDIWPTSCVGVGEEIVTMVKLEECVEVDMTLKNDFLSLV